MNHQSLGLPHARRASISTAVSAGSTTYGVLDYYADDGDHSTRQESPLKDEQDQHYDSYYTDETDKVSVNHRPLRLPLDSPQTSRIENPIFPSRNENHHANDDTINSVSMTMKLQKSSSLTRNETEEDIQLSRSQFAKFKTNIKDSLTIKDTSPSFPSPFRSKSRIASLTLKSSIKNSDYDRYGFKKTNQYITNKDYNDWWDEYCPYLIRRKAKWIKFFERNGLKILDADYNNNNNDSRIRFPTKSIEMAKFVKKGIPAEIRGEAWFNFVNGNEVLNANKGLYEELVTQSIDLVNEHTDAIEKDLHRTFPDNIYYKNLSPDVESPLLTTLRRVLKVFSIYKPTIGYCQSLNFIAGLLLLFLNEEKSFWMLVIICEKFLPGVHEHTLEGLAVNQGMLMLCLKQHLPDVWKIIMENDMDEDEVLCFESNQNNDTNETNLDENDTSYLFFLPTLTFCTTNWFMSLFIGVLPIETTLRIWDIIFYENSKTIFQVSLGIFKMLDPELKKLYNRAHTPTFGSDFDLASRLTQNRSSTSLQDSYNKDLLSSDLFQMIQNTPKRIINVNLFIEECYRNDSSTFSKISQQEINRCHEFVISSRERYAALVERRNELGMSQADRKQLLRQERNSVPQPFWMEQSQTKGLRTAYWNVGLNRRLRKIYSKGDLEYN